MGTQQALANLDFIPKLVGFPFYPCGQPIEPSEHRVKTTATECTISQRILAYYAKCLNDDGDLIDNPPLSTGELEVLRQWLIYYLHAPIWEALGLDEFAALQQRAFSIQSWKDLHDTAWAAIDFGLDPL